MTFRITDAALTEMRSHIGKWHTISPWNSEVTSDGIRHFALGVGDDNPMWWNPEYPGATGWGRQVAPPCFLFSCTSGPRFPDADALQGADGFLEDALALWVSDRWLWHSPAVVGQKISVRGGLADVVDHGVSKRGVRSVTQIERAEITTTGGEPLAFYDRGLRRFERLSETPAPAPREVAPRWTSDDLERIRQRYLAETRRAGQPRFVEEVRIGDGMGPLLKGPLTGTNIIGWLLGWGTEYCPTNRMMARFLERNPSARAIHPVTGCEETIETPHWDSEFAKESGIPAGYDFGGQRTAWIAHLLTDWAGDDAFVRELSVNFRAMNLIGDLTEIAGVVVAIQPERRDWNVECEIAAVNQSGTVTAKATARILLPSRTLMPSTALSQGNLFPLI
jgi:acyl dehydratase